MPTSGKGTRRPLHFQEKCHTTSPAPGTQTNMRAGFARLVCSTTGASPCQDALGESQMMKKDWGGGKCSSAAQTTHLPIKAWGLYSSFSVAAQGCPAPAPAPAAAPAPAPARGGTAPSRSCKCSFQPRRGTAKGTSERHRAQALADLKRGLHVYQAVLDCRPCKLYSQSHYHIK